MNKEELLKQLKKALESLFPGVKASMNPAKCPMQQCRETGVCQYKMNCYRSSSCNLLPVQ